MIKNRLAKLETIIGEVISRPCRKCYGTPFVIIEPVYESDPDGPGFRPMGECFLRDTPDRITDDLCCAHCGKPVVTRIIIKRFADEEREPGDRQIAMPEGLS